LFDNASIRRTSFFGQREKLVEASSWRDRSWESALEAIGVKTCSLAINREISVLDQDSIANLVLFK